MIPYYERFMARFPDLAALAAADARRGAGPLVRASATTRAARNLHAAAPACMRPVTAGSCPSDIDALMALPGIGRSTAGAILSLVPRSAPPDPRRQRQAGAGAPLRRRTAGRAAPQRARGGCGGSPSASRPPTGPAHFNQAMMDLGATLCTRTPPRLRALPAWRTTAGALAEGDPLRYPGRKPKRAVPPRAATLWWLARRATGALLLERRPPSGLWGGLWCLPITLDEGAARDTLATRDDAWRDAASAHAEPGAIARLEHGFSHFRLEAEVRRVGREHAVAGVARAGGRHLVRRRLPAGRGGGAPDPAAGDARGRPARLTVRARTDRVVQGRPSRAEDRPPPPHLRRTVPP